MFDDAFTELRTTSAFTSGDIYAHFVNWRSLSAIWRSNHCPRQSRPDISLPAHNYSSPMFLSLGGWSALVTIVGHFPNLRDQKTLPMTCLPARHLACPLRGGLSANFITRGTHISSLPGAGSSSTVSLLLSRTASSS
jgi:hypothetical protein